MKSALIIRHVPVEGIAGFREPVEAAGYTIDRIDVADPRSASLDVAEPEQDKYPWIACQQRRLARRLEASGRRSASASERNCWPPRWVRKCSRARSRKSAFIR